MAKSTRIPATFGPLVFAHPHLTSPDSEGQYADQKYKVDGAADPNSPVVAEAKKALAAACKTLGVDAKVANLPLKEQTEKNDSGTRVKTGKLIIRCKSQFAPAIADASGKPIPASVLANLKIGAGSEGLLIGYLSDYKITEKIKDKATGQVEEVVTPGVSFTLQGVQLTKLVKGGSQNVNFTAYQGGGFTLDELGIDAGSSELNIGSDADDRSAADEGDGGILDI